MFSFVTTNTAANFDILLISYVDNRAFLGGDLSLPGPPAYELIIYQKPINAISTTIFFLDFWLAGELLVSSVPHLTSRLSNVGYSSSFTVTALFSGHYIMNYWVIEFPFLIYLASLGMYSKHRGVNCGPSMANIFPPATGIAYMFRILRQAELSQIFTSEKNFGIPRSLISSSPDILLTLMITIRLVLHRRDLRNAIGPLVKTCRYCHHAYRVVLSSRRQFSTIYWNVGRSKPCFVCLFSGLIRDSGDTFFTLSQWSWNVSDQSWKPIGHFSILHYSEGRQSKGVDE